MNSDLPSHWKVQKLKHVASVQASTVDKHSTDDEMAVRLCNYTDVYKNDRITPDLPFMQATAASVEIARFGLRAGDVIITKDSEIWDDIAIPAYVPETLPGVVCGYHLSQIWPALNCLDGEFLFYALKSDFVSRHLHIATNGVTRFGLPAYAIENVDIPLPPLSEQRAIAPFLDDRTSRIDSLIAKKSRLLELLAEKRRSVITRAVTRGLDPRVQVQDTGIPWLSAVPAHWEVLPLSRCLESVMQGWSPPAEDRPAVEDEWAVIKTSAVAAGEFMSGEHKALPSHVNPISSLEIARGDVLMVRGSGSRDLA